MNQIFKQFILCGAAICIIGPGSMFGRSRADTRLEDRTTYVLAAPDTEMAKSPSVQQIFLDAGTELPRRPYAYVIPCPCKRNLHWTLWSPWLWGRYGLNR